MRRASMFTALLAWTCIPGPRPTPTSPPAATGGTIADGYACTMPWAPTQPLQREGA